MRAIAHPLSLLWKQSISVALLAQVVARRTKIMPDEAFLTGLLHGIGHLYLMVRAAEKPGEYHNADPVFMDLISGWHASIGKSILENWGFAEGMCEAVGEQGDFDRRSRLGAELTDVLIVSIVLAEALQKSAPREVDMSGVPAFQIIGLSAQDCATMLHAEYQLGSLQDALGC